MLMPAGLVACFRPLSDLTLFLILYGLTAVYFSGVMVKFLLTSLLVHFSAALHHLSQHISQQHSVMSAASQMLCPRDLTILVRVALHRLENLVSSFEGHAFHLHLKCLRIPTVTTGS